MNRTRQAVLAITALACCLSSLPRAACAQKAVGAVTQPQLASEATARATEMTRATAAEAGLLPKSGGTLTGPLVLSADPATALGAATQQYVLAHAGSAAAGTLISDDPTNAQGFGTTALANGVLYIQKIAGMVFGAGQSAAVQSANGTLLQKAITYCDTAQIECDEPDVLTVEVNLPGGLNVPASSNGWRGRFNKRFNIRQAANNTPVLMLGDFSGATPKGDVDWDGGELNYINDQTGNTQSVTFAEGSLLFSSISNLTISSETQSNGQAVHPGYDGWDRGSRSTEGQGFSFQNSYHKMLVSGAQASLFRSHLAGTGSHMYDIYWHNGGSISGAGVLSDTGIYWGGAGRSDDICERCNPEHFISPDPMHFKTVRNMTLTGTHFEDVGTPYVLISDEGSQVHMISTQMLNFRGTSNGGNTSNNVSILRNNYGGSMVIDTFTLQWDNTAPFASAGSYFFGGLSATEGADSDVKVAIHDLQVLDSSNGKANASNMAFEPQMPIALSIMQRSGDYVYDKYFSHTDGAEFTLNSNFMLYGQHANAVMNVPSSLPAAIIITLADIYHLGGTRPVSANWMARLDRSGGSYANTAAVVDAATPGTPLITSSAAGTKQSFIFANGANVTTN